MQIIKSDEHKARYVEIAKKYQVDDDRYLNLGCTDGVFDAECVEFAFNLFLILAQSAPESEISKAYNAWREFYHGDTRRIFVLFDYADMLKWDDVEKIWQSKWDIASRNKGILHEITCRIFILKGITTLKELYKLGALT